MLQSFKGSLKFTCGLYDLVLSSEPSVKCNKPPFRRDNKSLPYKIPIVSAADNPWSHVAFKIPSTFNYPCCMSHSSTPLSAPSAVSASQRLACRSALECAPAIASAEQCRFTLRSIPFSPCHAPQQHFVYRATTAFWTDGKMSRNANDLLMLLRQASPCQSNNIYSVMPALSKSFRQTWDNPVCPLQRWHIID